MATSNTPTVPIPQGFWHPTFSTTDMSLIDQCFEHQTSYYEQRGLEPPLIDLYGVGGTTLEDQPNYFSSTGWVEPIKKRKREDEEDNSFSPFAKLAKERKLLLAQPVQEVFELVGFPIVNSRDQSRTMGETGALEDDDSSSVSSSSIMTDTPSTLDLDADEEPSSTASVDVKGDESTSHYSSHESTSSDDTEAMAEMARTGRLEDLYPIDPAEDIINLKANNPKPDFSFKTLKDSPVVSRIPEFLAAMEAANKELEAEQAAGTISERRIEIEENDADSKDGQYIEMNLGLGVLEEQASNMTSSMDSEDSDNEGEDVMAKLMGTSEQTIENGAIDKKVKIEEL